MEWDGLAWGDMKGFTDELMSAHDLSFVMPKQSREHEAMSGGG